MLESSVINGLCVLRLASPPLNTLSIALLERLCQAIKSACSNAAVQGIVLIGSREHFSAGADLGLLGAIRSKEDAVRLARLFQDSFQAVEDSSKPVAAALAGRVMGGALELAMACHFRAAAEGSSFSMPEVKLGFSPGAGGTQRLPRLVGIPAALRMLLTGEAIDAAQARQLGLLDVVCPNDALLETARGLIRSHNPIQRSAQRVPKPLGDAAEAFTLSRYINIPRPEVLAPAKILEAVRAGLEGSLAEGLLKEREAFAESITTPAARHKIYLFFATRQTGRLPETSNQSSPSSPQGLGTAPLGEPGGEAGIQPKRAAVIGMGSMGTGIAQALAMAGLHVTVLDENEQALSRGMARISASLEKRAAQGKLTGSRPEAVLDLIRTTLQWEPLAEADVAIEAVIEDVATKREVIRRLEGHLRPQAILASNTSTISLDILAEGMRHPGRLLGMHFFHPAHAMPLVEVIYREATAPWAIAVVLKLAKELRKTAVVVKNREGFLVNRLFIPYCKEAFWLLQEGVPAAAIDAAMVQFGFPMGPLAVIDMAGIDILAHSDAVLRYAFPWHGQLPPVAELLVAQGRLGQKTGCGVYRYESGDPTPHPSEATETILAGLAAQGGRPGHAPVSQEEVTRRLVLRMVGEALAVLQEGIVQRESDIDVASVLGIGFPDFRGGVLQYARDLGLDRVRSDLRELADRFGERFRPPA